MWNDKITNRQKRSNQVIDMNAYKCQNFKWHEKTFHCRSESDSQSKSAAF